MGIVSIRRRHAAADASAADRARGAAVRRGRRGVSRLRAGRPRVPVDERAVAAAGGRADRPPGVVLILEPREHYAEPGDLPDALAAECGILLSRIERAVRGVGEIGRVHVCRWGDGSEHLHWWFMARPARIPQLVGSFAAIWDDIVPPVLDEIWRENLDTVRATLADPP